MTLLASAVGGWLAGYLGDRIGRVRTLQLTILWFSFFSLVCAFVQNFDQLLVARALLGLGFGGEWAAGAVLMGEAIRPQYRGRAVGSVQSGWAVGWGLAVLSQAVLFSYLPADRPGAGCSRSARCRRCWCSICAATSRSRDRRRGSPQIAQRRPALAMGDLFRARFQDYDPRLAWRAGCQGGYYAITFWLPRFLTTERHLSIVGSTGYLAALIIGSFIGYLSAPGLPTGSDGGRCSCIFSLGAIALSPIYTQAPLPNGILWLLGFPLGFFGSGYFSGMGAFLTEFYPTRLRGSGQGFCYNFGRGIGALFPFLVGYLSQSMLLADAIAIFAVARPIACSSWRPMPCRRRAARCCTRMPD